MLVGQPKTMPPCAPVMKAEWARKARTFKCSFKFLFHSAGYVPSAMLWFRRMLLPPYFSVWMPFSPAFSDARNIGAARTLPHLRLGIAAVACVLLAALSAVPAGANDDLAPETQGLDSREAFRTGTRFFDEAEVSGGLYFFRRDRRRYDVDKGRYGTNLNHASVQANADFVSGFAGGWLGFDFGVFGSHDIMNKGAVDHEMGFEPWGDPWHPDWGKRRTDDGVSVYKAALKAKAGPAWAKAGWFQPTGPGVLGVNWSIMPGTYRGVNAGADFGRLSLAAAWADEYKSPWFVNMNRFRRNDGETSVPWLWSAGARYAFEGGLTLELGCGASKNHLRNAHFKRAAIGRGAARAPLPLATMPISWTTATIRERARTTISTASPHCTICSGNTRPRRGLSGWREPTPAPPCPGRRVRGNSPTA